MKKLLFSALFAGLGFAASAQKAPDLAFGKVETVEATTTIEILNKGDGNAKDFWVEYKVGSAPKERKKIDMLEAGGMTEIEIMLPSNATGNSVKVWLDPGNKLKEKSESNNKWPAAVIADPKAPTKSTKTGSQN